MTNTTQTLAQLLSQALEIRAAKRALVQAQLTAWLLSQGFVNNSSFPDGSAKGHDYQLFTLGWDGAEDFITVKVYSDKATFKSYFTSSWAYREETVEQITEAITKYAKQRINEVFKHV